MGVGIYEEGARSIFCIEMLGEGGEGLITES